MPRLYHNSDNFQKKSTLNNPTKPKPSPLMLSQFFWQAPVEAFFSQETVAVVTGRTTKTLECDRWRGTGIPFRKVKGRVLYRKADVIAFLEGHELVTSTSQYSKGE